MFTVIKQIKGVFIKLLLSTFDGENIGVFDSNSDSKIEKSELQKLIDRVDLLG
jgi:hypothetical protein